ncbi:hypothetical protein HPB48_014501 [Haemaphysalis longicornis]|uniref:CCHC-type domain-containing protein n=1 Tax=Haemaphysalis longicornis TaxID=44386 RepID=A0A9J6GVV2_HAELO|nr:hypothetical protein HPB48_014501 [Haemaphysalis longicornis]
MVMEVTVEGTDIDPSELKESSWITKVTKKVTELQDQGRREKQTTNDICTAAAFELENKVKGSPAEKIKLCRLASSWQEGLSHRDYHDYPTRTTRLAANVHWERGKEEGQVVVNKIQGTITYSTPKKEDALKVLALKKVQFGSKMYEVATYMAAPEDCGRGVVHGIDRRITKEELEVGLSHPTNPPVLGVRRMGTSESVIINFGVSWVPRWVRILASPIQCFLYRKKHEVCFKCGQVGHRSDVCNKEPSEKCRKCGSTPSPTGEHDCTPKCQLCGKDHETGDRRCKALYRIPYLIKKRQWDRKLDKETRRQEEENGKQRQGNGPSTSKDTQRKSRQDQSRDRGRSKSRKRSKSRNRSVSFFRLPSLRKETTNNTTNLYSASVGARETPKHSTPKVGWGSGVTQDANAVITNELQEQNRSQKELRELREQNKLLTEQLKAMQQQIEEIKSAKESGPVDGESMQVVNKSSSERPELKQILCKLEEYEARFTTLERALVAMPEQIKSLKEFRADSVNWRNVRIDCKNRKQEN